jgi:hypothetical protein
MTQWKLVPAEPTTEMIDAGINNYWNNQSGPNFEQMWQAMLAAAPQPDVQPVAWMYTANGKKHLTFSDQRPVEAYHTHFEKSTPLFEHPPICKQDLHVDQWNCNIRDSVDRLLEQAGFAPDSSVRHQLAMMKLSKGDKK